MRAFALHPLESAINAFLRLDEDTIKQLAALQGKVILLNIEDWNCQFYLIPTNNGLELHRTYDQEPTTTISGKLDALIHLSRSKASSSSLFKNRVEVRGDLDTGEKIRNILANIDIDWEEKLSQLTGDVIAHKLGKFVREIKDFTKKSSDTLKLNLSEYLHYEVALLPSRQEVSEFVEQVTTLRNDVDRLEARLDLINRQGNT